MNALIMKEQVTGYDKRSPAVAAHRMVGCAVSTIER